MRRMLYLGLTEALKELRDENGQPLIRTLTCGTSKSNSSNRKSRLTPGSVHRIPTRAVAHVKRNRPAGRRSVPLHVVTKWKGSARDGSMFQEESLARFDLLDKIDAHLFNFFLSVRMNLSA